MRAVSLDVSAEPIDIVVTWVDGDDPQWRRSRAAHRTDSRVSREGTSEVRFRDWGALRYWFRAITKYCDWVRKIHLVTVNPTPDWLLVEHPKISVVHHEDIIDPAFLPTFNSRVIELNMHKIPGLAEKFVYFNDDMYVLRKIEPDHFFPGGEPAGMAIQTALSVGDNITHAMLNNLRLINETFRKREVLRANPQKWFTCTYGRGLLQNVALLPWSRFTGFFNHHLPIALTRTACEQVWAAYRETLTLTLESKFRQFHDANVFLFYYWQLCTGAFSPVRPSAYGVYEQLSAANDGSNAARLIRDSATPLLCLNDGDVVDYEATSRMIESAMATLLPERSPVESS